MPQPALSIAHLIMAFSNVSARQVHVVSDDCLCSFGVNEVIMGSTFLFIESIKSIKSHIGYAGMKCEAMSGTTTAAPLKCSDCSTAGTQYCTSNNGIFQCVCKTGKWERVLNNALACR